MTTVTFHMEGERIVGFTVQGHSGYADEGSDIISLRRSAILPGGLCYVIGTLRSNFL